MSFKSKFFSLFTLVFAVVAFSSVGLAQESTTKTPTPNKVERGQKGEGRMFGRGKFGRRGFGGRMAGPGMRQGRKAGMMFHGLDLTDAQKTQIQSIMSANKPNQEAREEMRTLMMARRAGVLTTAQQERLTAIQTQRQEKGRAVHEQLLGVLTAEQKAKIEQRKLERQTRMQERRQMRQPKAPAAVKDPKIN